MLIVNLFIFLLGVPFEIFFFGYTFKKIRHIKVNSLYYYFVIALSYVLAQIIVNFDYNLQYVFHLAFIAIALLLLKIKKININVSDVFLLYFIGVVISIASLLGMTLLGYNVGAMLLCRLLMIIFILGINKVSSMYNKYIYNWNRHKDNKIKSITFRNMFIIVFNICIFLSDFYLTHIFLQFYDTLYM